jgi:hypothetical protein
VCHLYVFVMVIKTNTQGSRPEFFFLILKFLWKFVWFIIICIEKFTQIPCPRYVINVKKKIRKFNV